jgi:hypothetical protein
MPVHSAEDLESQNLEFIMITTSENSVSRKCSEDLGGISNVSMRNIGLLIS